MSQEPVREGAALGADNETVTGNDPSSGVGYQMSQAQNCNNEQSNMHATELQRRRTEALERILMGPDSNLSFPHPTESRVRLGNLRRLRGQYRHLPNRGILPRREGDRSILMPFRTRSSMSALNLPVSQDSTRALSNLIASNFTEGVHRREGSRTGSSNRPRISSFFMELTYSTAEPNSIYLLKNSLEGQKRRMDIHAVNTMNIIKRYCPVKPHKMNQFRCCVRTNRDCLFNFQNVAENPLDALDPTQVKCNTKVVVAIRDDPSGKWSNSFTPYLMNSLAKKHINPTCITFQSEACLNTLVEQLVDDLHAFPKTTNTNNGSAFNIQAKRFLLLSTVAKLMENWSVPVLILDSCFFKLVDLDKIVELCNRFHIKFIDVDPTTSSGSGKLRKAEVKKVRRQVQSALLECNLLTVKASLKTFWKKLCSVEQMKDCPTPTCNNNTITPALLNDDCRRIVFNLHERISVSLQHQQRVQSEKQDSLAKKDLITPQISLLEDGILADIENTDAFQCTQDLPTPKSARSRQMYVETSEKAGLVHTGETEQTAIGKCPVVSEEQIPVQHPATKAHFSTALVREQEKISELLFNELNQRWRINGPQRFLPRTSDSGPYCSGLTDTEKQLLIAILQEVTHFETLKDIRNELKDSKKDLEGRLYGYNPDFSNLIASAEEFLHGKASCMEPCKSEMQFYKMPVSLVFTESEVKYLRSKPPTYVLGQDSPNQIIKLAIEESTKLFMNAITRTVCGSKLTPTSWRNKTKAVVVIEDNNEALELLTVALWFYEKTPLATFQSKYYYNTADFLVSLDACRFYLRSYLNSHYPTRKEDEQRLFERWLGVGMNGILRSRQSKIILIDFPRPGMHLQNSKSILVNRLKLEEKLNNIKSFIIGKPTRKEDNLSTVEKILDEIQNVLEPRDKLLFRKSRRMYMDLKLYKQIEQKSRQDLKALRDWGLPEPDNEHELWEKLRNSDFIINEHLLLKESDVVDPYESNSLPESLNTEISCCEDTSEPESACESERSKKSCSDYGNFISECEESIESLTVREEPQRDHRFFTTLQFHANRNINFQRTTLGAKSCQSNCTSEDNRDTLKTGNKCSYLYCDHLKCNGAEKKKEDCKSVKTANIISIGEPLVNVTSLELNHIPVSTNLQRSVRVDNLLDHLTNKTNDCSELETKVDKLTNQDVIDLETNATSFTKLEFTLLPKQTSDDGDSSFSTVTPRTGSQEQRNKTSKINTVSLPEKNMDDYMPDQDKNGGALHTNLASKTRLPAFCVAYVSKWGKSLAHRLHKRKSTSHKSFPQKYNVELNTPNIKPATHVSNCSSNISKSDLQENETTEFGDNTMKVYACKRRGKKMICSGNEQSEKTTWLRNILNRFRGKAYKMPKTNEQNGILNK